jgi:hypothetical protein
MATPAEIQAAMDAVPRPMPWPPWWAISTLRPSPPPKRPSEPPGPPPEGSQSDLTAAEPECLPAITEAVEAPAGGVGFHFDVEFQRRRWWWWRLKGSGWAGRLSR